MTAATRLLDRLERVRKTGPGRWIARCPAHADRKPSLSVCEGDDGRVLVHDFGGCKIGDVLAAVGLTIADLFDNPLGHHFKPSHSSIPAADRLAIVDHEITVAALILEDVLKDGLIDDKQRERLSQVVARIGTARAHGRP